MAIASIDESFRKLGSGGEGRSEKLSVREDEFCLF